MPGIKRNLQFTYIILLKYWQWHMVSWNCNLKSETDTHESDNRTFLDANPSTESFKSGEKCHKTDVKLTSK